MGQGTAALLTAFWPNELQIGAVFSLSWVGGCVWGLVQTQHAVLRGHRLTATTVPYSGRNPSLVVMLLSFLHMTAKLFLSFLSFFF